MGAIIRTFFREDSLPVENMNEFPECVDILSLL